MFRYPFRYLISDALPFGGLWRAEPNAIGYAIDYAKFRSRSHDVVIPVYDAAGNMIETHEQRAAADVQSSAPSVITKGEPPRKP